MSSPNVCNYHDQNQVSFVALPKITGFMYTIIHVCLPGK